MFLIDGAVADAALATDRGLAYGDGVFETIAVRHGTLLAWQAHFARLESGCGVLGIEVPAADLLVAECERVSRGRTHAVVKIIVTRGSGGRGYRLPQWTTPRRVVGATDWPSDLEPGHDPRGVKVWLCRHAVSSHPGYAGIKHLNRLDQVLASAEWPDADCFEGLMFDLDARLIEGTRSNLFLLRDGVLYTPALNRSGVRGIVRQAVLDLARAEGRPHVIGTLTRADLETAEEVFISNAIIGIRAVTEIIGVRTLSVGATTIEVAARLREQRIIP